MICLLFGTFFKSLFTILLFLLFVRRAASDCSSFFCAFFWREGEGPGGGTAGHSGGRTALSRAGKDGGEVRVTAGKPPGAGLVKEV